MERFAHRLRKNANGELPSEFIFVDTETSATTSSDGSEHHTLAFGWACYTRVRRDRGRERATADWFRFETIKEYWDWVETKTRPKTKLYMLAHNWGFDGAILALDREIPDRGWDISLWISGSSPPTIIKARKNRSTIIVVDTLNWFRSSLADLGDSVGIEKLEMPDASDTEAFDTYCKRDVEVIREAVLKLREFVRSEDLGNFQPTIAGQAFTAWRHKHMRTDVYVHANKRVLEGERDAYSGGRTSVFRLGKIPGDAYVLDVNSLYPSEMAIHDFPTNLLSTAHNPSIRELAGTLERMCVIARCTLTTDEDAYVHRTPERILFPVGTFTATLTTPELIYAFEHNHIDSVSDMYVYDKAPLFKSFVHDLYAARQRYKRAGDKAFQFMCKMVMNSLYGKFGQKAMRFETIRKAYPGEPPELLVQDGENDPVVHYRVRAGMLQRLNKGEEGRDSIPSIAAHVTAYGRMRLLALMNIASRENVYYCDTDSLFVNTEGFDALMDEMSETRLGALKLESVTDDLEIFGPKDYRLGAVEKIKGVRKNAVQLGIGRYQQAQFRSWNQGLKQGETGEVVISTIDKTMSREFKQGTVAASGRVEPFLI